jgi:hypothetical protein
MTNARSHRILGTIAGVTPEATSRAQSIILALLYAPNHAMGMPELREASGVTGSKDFKYAQKRTHKAGLTVWDPVDRRYHLTRLGQRVGVELDARARGPADAKAS